MGVVFRYPVRHGVRRLVRRRTGINPVVLGLRTVQLVRPTIGHQYSRRGQLDRQLRRRSGFPTFAGNNRLATLSDVPVTLSAIDGAFKTRNVPFRHTLRKSYCPTGTL